MRKKHLFWISLTVVVLILALFPAPEVAPLKYVERETGEIETEKVAGESWLVWLYYNPVGEAALHTLVKRKFVSELYGKLMDTKWSTKKIEPFIKDYGIDMTIAQKKQFETFNDFFIRKLKPNARPVNKDSNVIVSPGDGKILAYQNIENKDFIVKGYKFNVETFLNNDSLATMYKDGSMILLRLCPTDYHRFHFPMNADVSDVVKINGSLFSVNPIALKRMADIFLLNKREYVILANRRFGDVVMSEIGATMVGSIIQTYNGKHQQKGDEKGYFKFGGSSIILLFKKDVVIIDEDLLKNTENGLETQVKMGERIAVLNQ
jgi:phosphatidylserine decarboxylase